MGGSELLDRIEGGRGPIYLVFSMILMLSASIIVADMLTEAWSTGGLSQQLLYGVLGLMGLPSSAFNYLFVGIYAGLVITLILDSYKYVQGLLLAVASVVAVLFVFIPNGVLVGQLLSDLSTGTGLLTLIGVLLALWLSGVNRDRLAAPEREFPRAPTATLIFASVIVLFGFLEAHLAYQSPIVCVGRTCRFQVFAFDGIVSPGISQHVVAGGVLVGSLRYFTTYERNLDLIMIGPARSGKSAVFGGLHLYIRDHIDESGRASFRVSHLRSSIENGEFPDATQMAVQSGSGIESQSGKPTLLELPYKWGDYFPQRVRFHAIDYPGEALEMILADVVETAEQRSQGIEQQVMSDGGQSSGSDDSFDIPFSESDRSDPEESASDSSNENRRSDHNSSTSSGENASRSDQPNDTTSRKSISEDSEGLFDSESEAGDNDGMIGCLRTSATKTVKSPIDEINPFASWEAATRVVHKAENIRQMIPGVRGCLHNADRIILTLPLDDFVGPVIHRNNVPSYLEERVVRPDELGQYPRTDLRIFEYDGQSYGLKTPFQRAPPRQYLYWYEALRSVYPEKDFVVAATMADWVINDFRESRRTNPAVLAEGYDDFREHILEDVIREQTRAINQIFGGRNKGELYPLWYSIQDDEPPDSGDELRIDTKGPYAVLKGVEQFMEQINE